MATEFSRLYRELCHSGPNDSLKDIYFTRERKQVLKSLGYEIKSEPKKYEISKYHGKGPRRRIIEARLKAISSEVNQDHKKQLKIRELTRKTQEVNDLTEKIQTLLSENKYVSNHLWSKYDQIYGYETSNNNNNSNSNSNNNIPALIILQLEYILEFIENPVFHDNLLTLLFNSENGILTSFGYNIQQIFLLFSESLLELLSYLTYLQHGYSHKKLKTRHFNLYLNHEKVTISSKEFLKYSSNLCLNIVKSYQHLLDGPTFIVILQELLAHENVSVRQKSLEILSDRLQSLGKIRSKLDDDLYADLSVKLKATVSSCFNNNNSNSNNFLNHKLIGVSQSALLCIDILARQFIKNKEWIKPMSQYLSELVKLIENLSQHIYTDIKTSLSDKDEELKLLGSALLCCGTLSSFSKTKSLPFLPVSIF